jgi:hypothetical protein
MNDVGIVLNNPEVKVKQQLERHGNPLLLPFNSMLHSMQESHTGCRVYNYIPISRTAIQVVTMKTKTTPTVIRHFFFPQT